MRPFFSSHNFFFALSRSISFQVFTHAKVFFSIGGQHFNGEPVHFSYMPDTVMENARDVTIKLHHRIGKYVQVHLYFALRWIMLSEVTFVTGKRMLSANTTPKNTSIDRGQAPALLACACLCIHSRLMVADQAANDTHTKTTAHNFNCETPMALLQINHNTKIQQKPFSFSIKIAF